MSPSFDLSTIKTSIHRRYRTLICPPRPPAKEPNALRFGILGNSDIAVTGLISPARQHPFVAVVGVACHSRFIASRFAKLHGIPRVFSSYDELINDGEIDVVFIAFGTGGAGPAPDGLEWAMRALANRKHILLDTPAVKTEYDARRLFGCPMVEPPRPPMAQSPILLECAPYRFHPSWRAFESQLDRRNIFHAKVTVTVPEGFGEDGKSQFGYEQSGGARLGLAYALSLLRATYGYEPGHCTQSDLQTKDNISPWYECYKYEYVFQFPNDAIGEVEGKVLPGRLRRPRAGVVVEVRHRSVTQGAGNPAAHPNRRHKETRRVTLHYRDGLPSSHQVLLDSTARVYNADTHVTISEHPMVIKIQDYTSRGKDLVKSKPYWTAPTYQLNEFLKQAYQSGSPRGWVSPADSIGQVRMLRKAGEHAGVQEPQPSPFRLTDLPIANEFYPLPEPGVAADPYDFAPDEDQLSPLSMDSPLLN